MLLIKTETGQAAFKERSPRFSSRQRSAFILVDGKKTAIQLLTATSGLGVTQDDLDYLIGQGFLSVVFNDAGASAPAPLVEPESALAPLEAVRPPAARGITDQERYQLAKPIATQLTAKLGLRGFMLNLSVESAAGFDALNALFPQIQKAVGPKAAEELERMLKG